jgi:hypothetical protein
MAIKYLLDENVDPIYRQQFLLKVPDLTMWSVGDPGVPLRGTLDPEILVWCEENQFILITNNRKSMPVHLADHLAEGRHIPGILILGADLSVGENLEELILIAEAAFDDEFCDQIVNLPLPLKR